MTQRKLKIVIPGGSGHVGQMLARHFCSARHDVTVLSRTPSARPWRMVAWDGRTADAWTKELEGSDVCINLTGRSVDCRYDPAHRREIYDSRINSTKLLNQVIQSLSSPPRIWLNASTATIYRHSLDRAMDEATGEYGGSEPGAPDTWNFSIKVAKDWEAAFFAASMRSTRRVALRSAITFSPDRGSVFEVLSRLVRFGLGGQIGPGTQMVSWIHEHDFLNAVDLLIRDESFSGPVNVASPNPLPNRDFMRGLRRAWRVAFGLPSASWMVEIGSWALRSESELVLKSRYVVPGRLLSAGLPFQFPEWQTAASDLVARWRNTSQARQD